MKMTKNEQLYRKLLFMVAILSYEMPETIGGKKNTLFYFPSTTIVRFSHNAMSAMIMDSCILQIYGFLIPSSLFATFQLCRASIRSALKIDRFIPNTTVEHTYRGS